MAALFLYLIVINFSGQQFTIGQMISERQDTNVIITFWNNWIQYGFPRPKEVVMDSNQAQLIATITKMTECKTIGKYADACFSNSVPNIYIRIDVAHFIHIYARFLSQSSRLVKVFYLACLAKLISMTNKDEARNYIKAILTIALSKRAGILPLGQPSPCQTAKDFLRNSITGK